MKRLMWVMLVMCLIAAGLAKAETILWVSDCWDETDAHDQGFIDLLTSQGYTVDRLDSPRDMTAAKVITANGYDLVIVGRHGDSGSYDDTTPDGEEETLWNSITAPLINMNGYLWRNSRWKHLNSGTTFNTSANMGVVDSEDPLFGGIQLDENNQVNIISQGVSTILTITDAGNGTVAAYRAISGEEYVWIARWTTGQEYYVGAGQFAGGPRMVFAGGESGGNGDGTYNLTEQGELMFLNAVYEMSGATYDRAPLGSAGRDKITYIGDTVQLDGTAYDPEGAATITWSQLSGPGTANFSDTAIEDPTVTIDAKGTYTLQISVDDGVNPAVIDTLTVYVKDHADDALVAHWDFESLPEPNTLVDVANDFDGTYFEIDGDGEPNIVAGHITGSLVAADFLGNSYWEIPSPEVGDPNFRDVLLGLTVSAWTKIEDSPATSYPMLVGHGLDGWRFQVNNNRWNLVCHPSEFDVFADRRPALDPYWHHVVGVYDSTNAQVRIYIDGALEIAEDVPSGALQSGDQPLQVGNREDGPRLWPGQCDDLRVYNYALSEAEIAALTAEGDVVPFITAGEDQTVQYKGTPVALDATRIVDDGVPSPVSLNWMVVAVPLGAVPTDVVFSDVSAEDPTVTFPTVAGSYILSLTADDGDVQVTDEVNIVLEIPTCDDVIADGLGLTMDVSGPDGIPDCRVDIYDLAELAVDWLRCNDPVDITCEWPY